MSEDASQPPELEVKDFIFKQMRKLRVFKSPAELITSRASLLTVSNQYGILYMAGDNTTLKAIKSETLEKLFIEVDGSLQVEEEKFPCSTIDIGYPFSHIALSFDELTLAICFQRSGGCVAGFLDVRAFFSSKSQKKMFCEVILPEKNGAKVRDLTWNPAMSVIAVLLTNGQILMVRLEDTQARITGTLNRSVSAISWSPKGKQIVAGCKDGSLIQFTPDFIEKKRIPPPDMLKDPCEVSNIVWISTYQFGAVYSPCDEGENPSLILITTSKNGAPTFVNFDDLYYGMGEDREPFFYMNYVAGWNILLSIWSDSYEVVVIQNEKGRWLKWILPDAARAVLPTTHNHEETYPVGFGICFNAVHPIKQDDQTFSPAPILVLLSTDGVLCPFYMVNKSCAGPSELSKPAQPLAVNGERMAPLSSASPDNIEQNSRTGNITSSDTSLTVTSSDSPPIAAPGAHTSMENKIFQTSSLAFTSPLTVPLADTPPTVVPQPKNSISTVPTVLSSASKESVPSQMGTVPVELGSASSLSVRTAAEPVVTDGQLRSTSQRLDNEDERPENKVSDIETPRQIDESRQPFSENNSGTGLSAKLVPNEKIPLDKRSPSKQEHLEASFHKHIHNEVETFEEEMKEMRKRLDDLKKANTILKDIENKAIIKQATSNSRFMSKMKEKIKDLHDDVGDVKETVLESFEQLQDAKTRDKRGMDPRYLHLLKGRGLDPSSERKMKDVRSSYLKLDNTLREVNMALDERWNKENKQERVLQTPYLEFIYQTLTKNQNIAKTQSVQLVNISNQVKNQKLLKHRWDRTSVGSMSHSEDVVSLSERLRIQRLHTKLSPSSTVPARKQSELRNMLTKRPNVPVRKTTFISDRKARRESRDTYEESASSSDEVSEKEQKKTSEVKNTVQTEALAKEWLPSFSRERLVVKSDDVMSRSKPKGTDGRKESLFSSLANGKLGFSTQSTLGKKPLDAQTVPVKSITPLSGYGKEPFRPFTSTPVTTSLKVRGFSSSFTSYFLVFG